MVSTKPERQVKEILEHQHEMNKIYRNMIHGYIRDALDLSLRTPKGRSSWRVTSSSAYLSYFKDENMELNSVHVDIDGNVTVAKMWSDFVDKHYHAPVINIRLLATTGIMISLSHCGMRPTREALGLPPEGESDQVAKALNFNPHNALVPRIRAAWAVLRGRHNDKDVFG